ncbi:NAD(P)H-dependent oxidoreductase [Planctomycetota bacterium]
MKVLVVIGHQHKGSFNHAIADTVTSELKTNGHEVVYHDLYDEGFDPILPHEEIPPDAAQDPAVQGHIDDVAAADAYVIIHPNWWGQPPAMLKGWLDRCVRVGVAYDFTPEGQIQGLLAGRKALVFTTSNTPREVELSHYGDPLENLWKTCVFGFCGIEHFLRRNFESIVMSTPEQRAGWLEEVREIVREHHR